MRAGGLVRLDAQCEKSSGSPEISDGCDLTLSRAIPSRPSFFVVGFATNSPAHRG